MVHRVWLDMHLLLQLLQVLLLLLLPLTMLPAVPPGTHPVCLELVTAAQRRWGVS